MLKKCLFSFAILLAAGCLLFSSACGSSSQSSKALTQAQVAAIGTQMQQSLSASVTSITTTSCPKGSTSQYCTTGTVACSGGGTITITSDLSGSLGTGNSGQIDGTITAVPTNCSISGSNLVINGDPSIVFVSTIDVSAGQLTSMTAAETGAISYGPDPAGVCQINISNTVSFGKNPSCTFSGTVCGQTLNASCQ
jgi:hypothetical protein